ncbi:MAG: hypothetical protein U0270_45380 [Labilithrix sp.]
MLSKHVRIFILGFGSIAGLVLATASCSDDGDSTSASSSTSSSGSSGTSGSSSSSGSSSGSTSSSGAVVIDGVPAGDPAALNAWLQKKEYQAWAKDSAPRPFTTNAGGHSGTVRVYLNPKLDASMKAGDAEHPKGSVAVKEFLDGDTLKGWAASIKTEDQSGGSGAGWYWYEVLETTPGASSLGGQGSTTCTSCHADGKDFVRTPYPLK